MGEAGTTTGGSRAKGQDAVPLTQLAVRHLPSGDTDSMNESRCKKSQQEAEENWGGKRGHGGWWSERTQQAFLCEEQEQSGAF